MGKDRSRIWTGHGPANDAVLNNLVLVLLLRRKRVPAVPPALAPCSVRRADMLEACQVKHQARFPARRDLRAQPAAAAVRLPA